MLKHPRIHPGAVTLLLCAYSVSSAANTHRKAS